MSLPLEKRTQFGFIGALPNPNASRATIEMAEGLGYDSLWVGDHISFPLPILDPLLQIAQAAGMTEKLSFGTSVYLLPLRHPTPVAKQVATIDHLTEGRFIFGVGVGGEFPNEYAACGVPVKERGARMTEAMEVVKKLWTGEEVSNEGRFYPFPPVVMRPRPVQEPGPPIWTGGRSAPALERTGRLADGWISYVVTPDMYKDALDKIETAAQADKREIRGFGTGHLLFMRIDDTFEDAWDKATDHLSQRYAMDFRKAARKYAALGRPEDVAERVAEYHEAGVRHFVLDLTGPYEDRNAQIERFASEVRPLLPDHMRRAA